jgi:serine O-acetyltransferase
VVGIPGRVVFYKGKKVAAINLNHTDLPDPVADMLNRLQDQIDELRLQQERLENGVCSSGHKTL